MKTTTRILYILCFLSFLLVPLFMTNTESNVKSGLDNRMLTELPDPGEEGYEAAMESYLQDRIGLRDQMVTGYQLLNDAVAGELTHPTYTYGQDGYVFFKMHSNIRFGSYHRVFAEAVAKMKEYCESRGAKFYFLFDPEKISVYRRYLPEGVNYDDTWTDELISCLQELGVTCISNKEMLTDLSYEEQVYNVRYDAGHWNDLGCFYATNSLWTAMQADFSAVTPYTDDDFDISVKTGKYLAASRFPVNETIPSYSLKAEREDLSASFSDLKMHNSYRFFKYYINTSEGAENYPRNLVFHGSYYNRAPEFFLGRSREYIGVHDYQNVLNLDYYFNIFQPDAVVFEAAEYTFSDIYFDSKEMQSLDYNPSLFNEHESLEDAVRRAKECAEQYQEAETSSILLTAHDGFDEVFVDAGIPSARYVYLLTDDNIFDLKADEDGIYSTGVPHGAVTDHAVLYFEDHAGKKHWSYIRVEEGLDYAAQTDGIQCSGGAGYDPESGEYVFSTELKGNRFNAVGLQLLAGDSGRYLSPIRSIKTTGAFYGSYMHKEDSGWYLIRLKGNSNQKDEYADFLSYLVRGETYQYAVSVSELSRRKIVIDSFEFYGSASGKIERTELVGGTEVSAGVAEENGTYTMTTEVEGNHFNKVVLQLSNQETGELIDPLSSEADPGEKSGRYYHAGPSGTYFLKLRGNTNIKDEYIGSYVCLTQDSMYEWSYEAESISPDAVTVSDLSFCSLCDPIE